MGPPSPTAFEADVAAAPAVTKPKTYSWVRRREFAIGAGVTSICTAFGLWRLLTARREQRIAIALFDNEIGETALDRYANDVTDSRLRPRTNRLRACYRPFCLRKSDATCVTGRCWPSTR